MPVEAPIDSASAPVVDRRRYHGLDALRGIMMMLGIVIHAAAFYMAHPPLPVPLDRATSPAFDVLLLFIHSFRMPVFFVLAGFFASLLVEKYGLAGSYRNRAARVLLPLLLGLVTILPLTVWITLSSFLTVSTGEHTLLTDPGQLALLKPLVEAMAKAGMPQEPSPVHLWFLYYLCYFYLPLPLYAAFVGWSRRSRLQPILSRLLASPWMAAVFGLLTAATLWPFKEAVVLEGFLFFTPHPPSLLYYGTFFALGYLFHGYREVLETFRRHLGTVARCSFVLFPAGLAASLWERQLGHASTSAHALAVVLHGLCTWALIHLFIGTFLEHFDYDSPWIRFASQSSYWVYLVHMPVVGLAAWVLLPWEVSAFVKFPIVVTATSLVCFASYHYMARTTWVSVLLNGKRFTMDWPWREGRAPVSR